MVKVAFLCLAAVAAIAAVVVDAECTRTTVRVSTAADLKSAMKNVQPGDDIVIASGVYSITKDYYFGRSGVSDCPITMSGSGNSSVVLVGVFSLTSLSYFNISDLTIYGNNSLCCIDAKSSEYISLTNVYAYGANHIGVLFNNVDHATIANCTFEQAGVAHIVIQSSYGNILIENCTFGYGYENEAISIYHGWSPFVIRNNEFYSKKGDDSYFIFSDTACEISSNLFFNSDKHYMLAGISLATPSDSMIDNNYMEFYGQGSKSYAISLYSGSLKVCGSNKVVGEYTAVTNGVIDYSC